MKLFLYFKERDRHDYTHFIGMGSLHGLPFPLLGLINQLKSEVTVMGILCLTGDGKESFGFSNRAELAPWQPWCLPGSKGISSSSLHQASWTSWNSSYIPGEVGGLTAPDAIHRPDDLCSCGRSGDFGGLGLERSLKAKVLVPSAVSYSLWPHGV